ncbi:MAG: MBL fold metallo-hydrolase [Gemmatimonadota bacterium]|nr:MBL fold metallo-hydrolase [Gemmatimonadota bacterium]
MDRRNFIALGGAGLTAACQGQPEKGSGISSQRTGPMARSYPPVVQRSPAGFRVIHDRSTFIEQFKYEHWEASRDWKDDCELWSDFSWRWGAGTLPIQRRPMRVLEGLYLLGPEDYQQCIYLWDTGEGLLLVDPSYERFRPMIETQIRQLGWELNQVKWVLLTHMHLDHTESAQSYAERGAEVFIHKDDAGAVRGEEKMVSAQMNRPVKQLTAFNDGDTLSFGPLEMKVIHTPGHTPGACCFTLEWQSSRIFISEDIVLHYGRHAWMGADYCDWDQYLASLWKMYRNPEAGKSEVLLPGHGTLELEGASDSLYKALQVVSHIISLRRSGEDIDWVDPYKLFWQRKIAGSPEIVPLES